MLPRFLGDFDNLLRSFYLLVLFYSQAPRDLLLRVSGGELEPCNGFSLPQADRVRVDQSVSLMVKSERMREGERNEVHAGETAERFSSSWLPCAEVDGMVLT